MHTTVQRLRAPVLSQKSRFPVNEGQRDWTLINHRKTRITRKEKKTQVCICQRVWNTVAKPSELHLQKSIIMTRRDQGIIHLEIKIISSFTLAPNPIRLRFIRWDIFYILSSCFFLHLLKVHIITIFKLQKTLNNQTRLKSSLIFQFSEAVLYISGTLITLIVLYDAHLI